MKRKFLLSLVFSFMILFTVSLASTYKTETITVTKTIQDEYKYETFNGGILNFNYCLYSPAVAPNTRCAMIVFLLPSGSEAGLKSNVNKVSQIISTAAFKKIGKTYAIIPQLPENVGIYDVDTYQAAIKQIIDSMITEGKVDRDRVYAVGAGSGGTVLYNAITKDIRSYTAVQIDGGDPSDLKVELAKSMPIHLIQSEDDPKTQNVINIYNRLVDVGDRFAVLTLYPTKEMKTNGAKNTWEISRKDLSNTQWLYSFAKQKTTVPPSGKNGLTLVNGKSVMPKPQRLDRNTLVSLNDVGKALGYTIDSDTNDELVLSKGTQKIVVSKKAKTFTVNGTPDNFKVPVYPLNGKVLVRGDFFSKYADCRVVMRTTGAGFQVIIDQK